MSETDLQSSGSVSEINKTKNKNIIIKKLDDYKQIDILNKIADQFIDLLKWSLAGLGAIVLFLIIEDNLNGIVKNHGFIGIIQILILILFPAALLVFSFINLNTTLVLRNNLLFEDHRPARIKFIQKIFVYAFVSAIFVFYLSLLLVLFGIKF
ncbi:hypothetical protein [Acidiphilium cryptum]|uniref:Uncharacterized protein n=1 Tax=Acidiphilium cryptum (strain JF-5) TaxID=349163 RepID=A5G1B5_ACICJ|nr:hypothetical protein [Acidiphilium cryptum]ABQ31647.1 hypothetical protein Acry_2454 [Acidiphilium cryptum JF-5]